MNNIVKKEKKLFEVELASTTYRTFEVEADSPAQAQDIAFSQMDADWEISKAWKENAEVSYTEELEQESEEDSMELK